ncbi:helix-turn-helix transcriptional regulator [Saccharibacillus alkalitolerans]|uniref:AraC family transcriptional regulator n=1 Tax=Saccharibacillus alkalitolerans TaxID=2705290 RepID=A0ABX0F9Z5_9BACL|nr:helix-turn-helix domain-containing protein [Saccharibacillus alkalitolerans]NGZ76849.1 AraC family transcriptional regulator [Saccharibacillus alkalitolerans]
MPKYMDYTISRSPIRVLTPSVEPARLRIRSVAIVNAGHLPGRTMRREGASFQYWALVLITGGKGFYRVDGGEIQQVSAGSWFCLYPGAEFHYGPHPGEYWDEYYFTAEGSRIEEWRRDWLSAEPKVRKFRMNELLLQRMENMLRLIEGGTPDNLDRTALQLESFLYELISEEDGRDAGGRERFAQEVIEDIQAMLHVPPTVSDIAARHHVSVSTLRRIVHDYTGYPFNEFVHRLRTAEARNVLLNTDMSVKEIGERLGYKDMFYFSRVFKRITGVSPREYRSRVGP